MNTDTIASIVTAFGTGAVGIIRLSGTSSLAIVKSIFRPSSAKFVDFKPYTLHRGNIVDSQAFSIDDVLAVYMPAPNSFTGEDIVEIQAHGGTTILLAIMDELLALGARQAEAGEFSKRAFLNSRIDLAQAEAIAEMIASPSKEGLRLVNAKLHGALGDKITLIREQIEQMRMLLCANLDFLDEDIDFLSRADFSAQVSSIISEIQKLYSCYEGARTWQEGALIVIAGRVNAGKSSLMNNLLARKRAIVTPIAGTTRDYLEEQSYIQGIPVRLVDTAGLRISQDPIENAGIELSRSLAASADLVLIVVDSTLGFLEDEQELLQSLDPQKILIVWNKCDLPDSIKLQLDYPVLQISAKNGLGIDMLTKAIARKLKATSNLSPSDILPNKRQADLLKNILNELTKLNLDIKSNIPYDILAVSLELCAQKLGQITGLDATEDMINSIFTNFCIGK